MATDKIVRIGLPVSPRGNYELTGSFTLPGDGTPSVLIPTTHSRGLIHWRWNIKNPSEPYSAFEMIDGKGVGDVDNPTRVPSKVQVGQRHAFRVRVVCEGVEAEVTVELDGNPYIHWKGQESAITLWRDWEVPHKRTLGIGMDRGCVTYHDLKLKMLDGEAWLLRPTSESAAAPGGTEAEKPTK